MPDGTIMVTDVRVKRTIRDYAKVSTAIRCLSILEKKAHQLKQMRELKKYLATTSTMP